MEEVGFAGARRERATGRRLSVIEGLVRVEIGGATLGAGFLVAPQVAVTCAHVACHDGDAAIVLHFVNGDTRWSCGATVRRGFSPASGDDIAVLDLAAEPPARFAPLPVAPSGGTAQHAIRAYGFPEAVAKDPERLGPLLAQGTLVDDRFRLLQIRSSTITPGFSGGPVWDDARQAVIGMVDTILGQDQFGRLDEIAYATPSETLARYAPEISLHETCPFPGLGTFREADASLFVRAPAVVERLQQSLTSHPQLLAIVGPSGSGKSSLLHARILPWLRTTPPLALARSHITLMSRPEALTEDLALLGLGKLELDEVRRWLEQLGAGRWVVVLDQFEDFVRSLPGRGKDPGAIDLERFFALLTEGMERELVTVIVTMRVDAHADLAEAALPRFLEIFERGQVVLPLLLSEAEVRSIVEVPLRRVGHGIESGLLDRLLGDLNAAAAGAGASAGHRSVLSSSLPLLQATLAALWDRRSTDRHELTTAGYDGIDGVHGAIGHLATEAIRTLPGSVTADDVRWVMLELCYLLGSDDSLRALRQRRTRDELRQRAGDRGDAVILAIGHLVEAHLIATGARDTVEVVHEVLFRAWPVCAAWLRERAPVAAYLNTVEARAERWCKSGPSLAERDRDMLLRGEELAEGQAWLKRERTIPEPVRSFLVISESEGKKERVTKRVLLFGGIFAALSAIVAIWILTERAARQSAVSRAEQSRLEALLATRELRKARAQELRRQAVELVAKGTDPDKALTSAMQAEELDASDTYASAWALAALAQRPYFLRRAAIANANRGVGMVRIASAAERAVVATNAGWSVLDTQSGTSICIRDAPKEIIQHAGGGPPEYLVDITANGERIALADGKSIAILDAHCRELSHMELPASGSKLPLSALRWEPEGTALAGFISGNDVDFLVRARPGPSSLKIWTLEGENLSLHSSHTIDEPYVGLQWRRDKDGLYALATGYHSAIRSKLGARNDEACAFRYEASLWNNRYFEGEVFWTTQKSLVGLGEESMHTCRGAARILWVDRGAAFRDMTAVSSQGTAAAVGYSDGTIELLDGPEAAPETALRLDDSIAALRARPDQILAISEAGTIAAMSTGMDVTREVPLATGLHRALLPIPESAEVLVAVDANIHRINLDTGKVVEWESRANPTREMVIRHLALSPKMTRLLSVSDDALCLWDVPSRSILQCKKGGYSGAGFLDETSFLAAPSDAEFHGIIVRYEGRDLANGKIVWKAPEPETIFALRVAPNGRLLEDFMKGSLLDWGNKNPSPRQARMGSATESSRKVLDLFGGEDVNAIDLDARGLFAVVAGERSTAIVDLVKETSFGRYSSPEAVAASFDRSGRRFAVASKNRRIRVHYPFDVDEPLEIRTPREPLDVAFSGDDRWILFTDFDSSKSTDILHSAPVTAAGFIPILCRRENLPPPAVEFCKAHAGAPQSSR